MDDYIFVNQKEVDGFYIEGYVKSQKGHNASFMFHVGHDEVGDEVEIEFNKETTIKLLNLLLRELGGCVLGNLSEREKTYILDLADEIRNEGEDFDAG